MFTNKNQSFFFSPRKVFNRRPKEILDSDGSIFYQIVDCEPIPIPAYTEYDLESLLKAGVNLDKVNTFVLGNLPLSDDVALKKVTDILSSIETNSTDVSTSKTDE